MKKTEQRKRGGGRHPGGGESASVEIEIERLRRRFEVFRRDHEPGTRIPEVLRAAVLAALDRGASEGALRRVCQASSVQLKLWRAQLRQAAEVGAPAEPPARVFEVVDGQAKLESTPSREPSGPELELRFGGWAVRIGQLGG